MNRTTAAHLSVFAANLIYGANYSIAKEVMPAVIGPSGFILLRVVCAAILFAACRFLFVSEKIELSDYLKLILCSITGVVINQLFFFKGLALTSPINSGLIMVTNPVFVLLISAIFAGEFITKRKILGILCGITGVVMLIIYSSTQTGFVASSPLGDFYILLNSFSYAVYLVMVKPLMKKYNPITVMHFVFVAGAVFVLPFGYNEFSDVAWNSLSASAWYAIIFVVIATTFLAYLFNTFGLKELSAGTVSIYIYLQPLLAALFAIILGADMLRVIHIAAATLIFIGIYIAGIRPSVKPASERNP